MEALLIALITLATAVLLVAFAVVLLNKYVNDWRVKSARCRVRFNGGDKIMYIVAHPDDEVLLSGTMSLLKRKFNLPVKALYLTHGEDGPTNNLVPKSGLKAKRTEELNEVKSILSLDELVIADYPDRYLSLQDSAEVKKRVEREVEEFCPTYIFTFDENVGMYGHADHVTAGKIATEVALETDGVKGVFQMTLPQAMLKLALKVSKTFKEGNNPERGLPLPNVKFNIYRYNKYRYSVTQAHATQAQVMSEMQPLYNKLPRWLYYLIFNCEYFSYLQKN